MPRNKHFRVESPRIVPAPQGGRGWLWLLLLSALAGWTWLVYEYSLSLIPRWPAPASATGQELASRIEALEQERDRLLALASTVRPAPSIANEEGSTAPDIQALREERDAIAEQVASLRRQLARGGNGFELRDYSLRRQADGRSYAYAFTLAKREQGDEKAVGSLRVKAIGQASGPVDDLPPVTAGDAPQAHRLGFRQYQEIEGSLRLPDDFAPQQLLIEVELSEPETRRFAQLVDWVTVAD
jgi:hypothetical protein